MTTRFRWERCPCCSELLPFHQGQDEAIAHLLACAREKQLLAHPEVADVDQIELGCENLAPRDEGPESAEEIENHEGNLFGGHSERKTKP